MKAIMTTALALSLLVVTGCSSSKSKSTKQKNPDSFQTNTSFVPAAQGQVNTSQDVNGNTNLRIQVKHLAEPSAISQGANGYVVWIQPQGTGTYQNIGTLKVNENLEGNYSTSVPYSDFHLMVTPESNTMAQRPTGVSVLEKNVNL